MASNTDSITTKTEIALDTVTDLKRRVTSVQGTHLKNRIIAFASRHSWQSFEDCVGDLWTEISCVDPRVQRHSLLEKIELLDPIDFVVYLSSTAGIDTGDLHTVRCAFKDWLLENYPGYSTGSDEYLPRELSKFTDTQAGYWFTQFDINKRSWEFAQTWDKSTAIAKSKKGYIFLLDYALRFVEYYFGITPLEG